jgi:hypothetical protein
MQISHQGPPLSPNKEPSSSNYLPIQCFDHPLDKLVSLDHIEHIHYLIRQANITPESHIISLTSTVISLVTHKSFTDLLTYGTPINDSIVYQFLCLAQLFPWC